MITAQYGDGPMFLYRGNPSALPWPYHDCEIFGCHVHVHILMTPEPCTLTVQHGSGEAVRTFIYKGDIRPQIKAWLSEVHEYEGQAFGT